MILQCFVVCVVCGLIATCVFVFLAYRYLLSSNDAEVENPQQQQRNVDQKLKLQKQSKMPSLIREAEVEKPPERKFEQKFEQKEEQKVARKRAKMSSSNASDSGSSTPATVLHKIPASVLRKINDVTVLEKTANFTVGEQVRLVANATLRARKAFSCSTAL